MIKLALGQYGIKEISGEVDNPEVLKYFSEIGLNGTELKDETAWCSAFVNWVAKKSDKPYTGKLNARSWLDVGEKVTTPQINDLVVLWRQSKSSWKGHVGFYVRETESQIYMLGGNQGNTVCIAPYPKKRLLNYIRL